jgi:hypothetical protein
MKALVDKTFREYEEKMKNLNENKLGFLSDVRKKLGEVVESIHDIHVSDTENIVIDVIGDSRNFLEEKSDLSGERLQKDQ